ncbi:30S ribosomal protein S6 [Phytophthora cinnamomi]|uniref:30S ribosomal protein S6 n=1 Tax=Phytophthora cinnamomi TaxID=4785 RepID=UPI0035597970|nr:30S ribosomal protein S6 [Phytophthora cinnamomi]
METRRQATERQLALANGPVDPADERINNVEATMAEMDERIGQVNHHLDRILEGIDALELAQQTAAAVANLQQQQQQLQQQQPSAAQVPSRPRRQQEDVEMATSSMRQLQKMETKPPIFEGDIDGVKLNSFIFQFESYFVIKGYDLTVDDAVVGLELGQCVRKYAATWYETYMTNPMTANTWSAMKGSMEKNFKEPNFQQKLRNELLNFKQRGSYQGYVAKFQEKLRLVPLDPVFAMEIFLKGLSSSNLRKQFLRKKPATFEEVISEGFSEVELERLEESKPSQNSAKNISSGHSKGKFSPRSATLPSKSNSNTSRAGGKKKCHHCEKGYHNPDECWTKYPEKRPGSQSSARKSTQDKTDYRAKYYALVDKLVVDDVDEAREHLNE